MLTVMARRWLVPCALLAASTAWGIGIHSLGPVDIGISTPTYQATGPRISGDGSTVAGCSARMGFKWTPAGGKVNLPNTGQSCYPSALSYDGSIIVGQAYSQGDSTWRAAKWTSAGESLITPFLDAYAKPADLSNDGSVIAGQYPGATFGNAFKWTSTALWDITGVTSIYGVSGDGSKIVGNKYEGIEGKMHPHARLWSNLTYTDIPSVVADGETFAMGISADGNVVFGYLLGSADTQLFRWTNAGGTEGLPAPTGWAGGLTKVSLTAGNVDGSVLVGSWGGSAIIWDAGHATRYLQDALVADYGLNLAGWSLTEATGISDDGQTIVGYGTGPSGGLEGFVIVVPEPASLLLVLVLLGTSSRAFRPLRRRVSN